MSESVQNPLTYCVNNVQGTISLLQAIQACDIKTLVFNGSAMGYDEPQYFYFDKGHPTLATNPYGRTKLHIEQMFKDLAVSDSTWHVTRLRNFNADVTDVRDNICVMDLSEGHVAVSGFLKRESGWHAISFGTSTVYSILDMVNACEGASGQAVPYRVAALRDGDVAQSNGNPQKAAAALGCTAESKLCDMCTSTWRFQSKL